MKSENPSANGGRKLSHRWRMLCDYGPLLVFFAVHRFYGLQAGTGALIATTLASLAAFYVVERRIAMMPLFSGLAVSVFGGITLLLHDETFIKIKPTVLNLLFAAILLGGAVAKKPMLKYLLGEAFSLTEAGWLKLSVRWGFYFIFLAVLNEVVWRHFSTDFWVNFKVFGMFTCTIIFTLFQIPLIQRHLDEK